MLDEEELAVKYAKEELSMEDCKLDVDYIVRLGKLVLSKILENTLDCNIMILPSKMTFMEHMEFSENFHNTGLEFVILREEVLTTTDFPIRTIFEEDI